MTHYTSIIVPSYDRAAFLQHTVASLSAQNYIGGFEIIIVDNAPSAKIQGYVASLGGRPGSQVRYIPEKSIGLHHARHAGAKASRGDVLVYVDDDVLAEPGWLAALLEPYQDDNVACVGGKVLPCWEATPPKWVYSLHPGNYSLLDYGDDVRELRWPEDLYGCNFSIRKTVLFEVGGFNPDGFRDRRLIWYRGDGETGLLRKVYAAGYKVVYAPRAVLYHRMPASRLTPSYVRRRAFDQAISDEYSRYHEQHISASGLVFRAADAVMRVVYHALRAGVSFLRHDDTTWVKETAAVAYMLARSEYNLRLSVDPKLREHVLRKSYLDLSEQPDRVRT
jgi:glycosyltransferase involved in cell wall biosynthesis